MRTFTTVLTRTGRARRPKLALHVLLLALGVSAIAASPSSEPVTSSLADEEEGDCLKVQIYYWIDDPDEDEQYVVNQCPPTPWEYGAGVVAHEPVPVTGVDSGVGVTVLVPVPPLPPVPPVPPVPPLP